MEELVVVGTVALMAIVAVSIASAVHGDWMQTAIILWVLLGIIFAVALGVLLYAIGYDAGEKRE